MIYETIYLLFMLVLILVASQLFTNALEHVGEKIGLSAGVTGSIFAAVATALPETMVPILAIVAGTQDHVVNEEISVGAILGAPLMLSTLSTGLLALSAIKRRTLWGEITPEKTGLARDLNFFLCAFFFAALAMYTPLQPVYLRASISVILIAMYALYLFLTCYASKRLVKDGHGVVAHDPLLFAMGKLRKHKSFLMGVQLCAGFLLLVLGAKGFIHGVVDASKMLHVSPLLLSLLIIPIATELPEKVNSILWIRQHKDTLGFGNITGAMVFQGTLLPALGILMTPWQPSRDVELGILITFIAAAWLRWNARVKGQKIVSLLVNGGLYVLYLYLVLGPSASMT